MTNKIVLSIAVGAILSTSSLLHAAAVITNGGFDSWTITSTNGTTLSGTPTGWTYSGSVAPIQGPTLTSGSGYSAVVVNSTAAAQTTGVFAQNVVGGAASFALSFDLAVARNAGAREFQLILGQAGGQRMNLILNAGTTGLMTLQAYDSVSGDTAGQAGWKTLGANIMSDSGTYNATTNSFSNLNVYTINLAVDWAAATPTYTFTYTLNGVSTSITNIGSFFTAPTVGGALSSIQFYGANSAVGGYYALDNISLSAIPEPTAMAMMFGGLLLLGGRFIRRKASLA